MQPPLHCTSLLAVLLKYEQSIQTQLLGDQLCHSTPQLIELRYSAVFVDALQQSIPCSVSLLYCMALCYATLVYYSAKQ